MIQDGSVPSPIQPLSHDHVHISDKQLEQIKELLGVECVFIVAQKKQHNCDAHNCLGHRVAQRITGFSSEQIAGMAIRVFEETTGSTVEVEMEEDDE